MGFSKKTVNFPNSAVVVHVDEERGFGIAEIPNKRREKTQVFFHAEGMMHFRLVGGATVEAVSGPVEGGVAPAVGDTIRFDQTLPPPRRGQRWKVHRFYLLREQTRFEEAAKRAKARLKAMKEGETSHRFEAAAAACRRLPVKATQVA